MLPRNASNKRLTTSVFLFEKKIIVATAPEFYAELDRLAAEAALLDEEEEEMIASNDIFDDEVMRSVHLPTCVALSRERMCGELLPPAVLLEADGQIELANQVSFKKKKKKKI